MPIKSKHPSDKIPDISLYTCVIEGVERGEDAVAVIDNSRGGKSITCKEIKTYSQSCAGFLYKQGLRKGDFVGICANICVEYPVMMLGILACGATVTFCNPTYTKDEILQQLRISKPKMIFVDEEAVETIEKVQKEEDIIKNIFVNGKSKKFTTLNDMIQSEHATDFPKDVQINPNEDIALLPYSSGTTGLPKCVMTTHRNAVASISGFIGMFTNTKEVVYLDRPVYHVGGYVPILIALAANIKLIVNRVDDLKDFFEAVDKYKVTMYTTVPSLMIRCVQFDNLDKYDTSSLKVVMYGGAAIAPEIVEKMGKKLNAKMIPGYGMTEAGRVAQNIAFDQYPTSVGTLSPGNEVKIVDPLTDEELPVNENGEILLKNPMVMKGYLNNEDANKKAFTIDGWFRTGDIGHFDKDEHLYVIDRIKEVIKYKSVQVSPAELENVIFKLPQVADVGVIGIPHEYDGEVPKAFVVRKDDSLSVAEVNAFVKEQLADYKQLRGGVAFVDSIPKSATGKIQRNILKKMAENL